MLGLEPRSMSHKLVESDVYDVACDGCKHVTTTVEDRLFVTE